MTPLHLARSPEIANVLLQHGANAQAVTKVSIILFKRFGFFIYAKAVYTCTCTCTFNCSIV